MKIEINDIIIKELNYMVALHQQHGPNHHWKNVEQLVAVVLSSIADGSRRPGSWERSLLQSMGLVADCEEHHCYRTNYGEPTGE